LFYGDFGENITKLYDLAIHLTAPADVIINRVEQRAFEQHGERIREGGDMYEQERKFFNFVATRPISFIERWAETLECSVMRLDGTVDYKENAAQIVAAYHAIQHYNLLINEGMMHFMIKSH
jgi:hypothetical protein